MEEFLSGRFFTMLVIILIPVGSFAYLLTRKNLLAYFPKVNGGCRGDRLR
jgi:hypothetical protein